MNKANFSIRAIPDRSQPPYAIRASRRNTAIPLTLKSQAAPAHAANACARSKSAKKPSPVHLQSIRRNPSIPVTGPIFVHETPCAAYSPQDKFPDTLRSLPLVFEGTAAIDG